MLVCGISAQAQLTGVPGQAPHEMVGCRHASAARSRAEAVSVHRDGEAIFELDEVAAWCSGREYGYVAVLHGAHELESKKQRFIYTDSLCMLAISGTTLTVPVSRDRLPPRKTLPNVTRLCARPA